MHTLKKLLQGPSYKIPDSYHTGLLFISEGVQLHDTAVVQCGTYLFS